jgi:hypothetical protein
MNLSNTGGAGRGSDKGEIIGKVILHGKKEFWLRGGMHCFSSDLVYQCVLLLYDTVIEDSMT